MNEEISNLVELMFNISQKIDDWDYMKIMTSIQKINIYYNEDKNQPNQHELLYYKLLKTHNRLKRDHKRIFKRHKEQIENLNTTIEELQHEVLYLEQNRPKEVKVKDFINEDTILI